MIIDETDNIEVDGFTFHVAYCHDDDAGRPWDNCDGHGDVRSSAHTRRHGEGQSDKKPGERPMNRPSYHEQQFYYDWAGACKKARADEWNTEPYDAPNRVQRAVQADFDYLRGYVNNDWNYVVVSVTLANRPKYVQDSCGVETFKDYHLEFAEELAREILREYLDDMEKNQLKGMEVQDGYTD